jgi:uncharacterized delta-60 repeat protein
MKKLILASTIALGLAACNPPTPNPDVGAKPGLRLLEVTIDLRNNDASAVVLEPNRQNRTATLLPQATTSIEVNRIGVGFHDDNDGAGQTNPTRYVYAVFRVENNTGTALNNFTTWALNVPALSAGIGPTRVGTMFKSVKDGAGLEVADDNIVRSIEPTHGIRPDLAGIAINSNHADLQIIGPIEKTNVQSQLAATYGGLVADVLGYGYVARKNNGAARDIGATNGVAGAANSCSADSCKGFLTLAFKVPVATLTVAPRSSRPTVFSFIFALGDQTDDYTTQSIKDQKGAVPTIAGLPTTTFFGTPRLLGGSTIDFRKDLPDNLCQVETARPSGALFTASVLMPATVDLVTTPGTLDTCYGSGGLLEGNFGGVGINTAKAAILDSQGRMIVVGSRFDVDNDFVVYRFKPDGQLDKTFNGPNGGSRSIGFNGSDIATGVALDSNNKIVVVGIRDNQDIAVTRLNDDGTLDTTFNAGGVGGVAAGRMVINTTDTLTASGVDTVGTSIYISGTYSSAAIIGDFLAAKVRSDGIADPGFGPNGFVNRNIGTVGTVDAATSIEAVSDNEIYLAGTTDLGVGGARDWAVAKLNSSGIYDNTFNGNGRRSFDPSNINLGVLRTLDSANAIKLDSSGRLVIAGSSGGASDSDFAVARMTTTGSFDTTFNSDGVVISGIGVGGVAAFEFGTSLAFTSTGSIMVGGYTNINGNNDFVARKFSATSGTLLTEYGPTDFPGTATGNDRAQSIMVNASGKVILVGIQGDTAPVTAIAQYNP